MTVEVVRAAFPEWDLGSLFAYFAPSPRCKCYLIDKRSSQVAKLSVVTLGLRRAVQFLGEIWLRFTRQKLNFASRNQVGDRLRLRLMVECGLAAPVRVPCSSSESVSMIRCLVGSPGREMLPVSRTAARTPLGRQANDATV